MIKGFDGGIRLWNVRRITRFDVPSSLASHRLIPALYASIEGTCIGRRGSPTELCTFIEPRVLFSPLNEWCQCRSGTGEWLTDLGLQSSDY